MHVMVNSLFALTPETNQVQVNQYMVRMQVASRILSQVGMGAHPHSTGKVGTLVGVQVGNQVKEQVGARILAAADEQAEAGWFQ